MKINFQTKCRFALQINNAIVNQTSPASLFQALATELKRIFHYDRFSIKLYDPGDRKLSYFSGADGIDPIDTRSIGRHDPQGSIAQMVMAESKPIFIQDLKTLPQQNRIRAFIKAGLKCTMAAPLIIKDQPLGSIHLFFKHRPDDLDPLFDFLNDVAKQVSIAVYNMLIYKRLEETALKLESEREYLIRHENNGAGGFYFSSPLIVDLMDKIDLIARTDVSVFITGETGTGKDRIARIIHNKSLRRNHMFVSINCPALSSSLIETELFGHKKGAFTGAVSDRVGRFELADGGTIFLDEICDLPLDSQAKLLHVLQEKSLERVGESETKYFDFRVITATNHDVQSQINDKCFRSDLYYRLNTFSIHVPPLRRRLDCLPGMVQNLSQDYALKMRRKVPRYSSAAVEALCEYPWPGNIRELENFIQRMIILYPGGHIGRAKIRSILEARMEALEIPDASLAETSSNQTGGFQTLHEVEKNHIRKALRLCNGIVGGHRGAASLLGIPRTTLQNKIRKHHLRDTGHTGRRKFRPS